MLDVFLCFENFIIKFANALKNPIFSKDIANIIRPINVNELSQTIFQTKAISCIFTTPKIYANTAPMVLKIHTGILNGRKYIQNKVIKKINKAKNNLFKK